MNFLQGGLIKKAISDCLLIALEPEAASLYVRKVDIGNTKDLKCIKSGTKYLVIDAGGTLTHFVCHALKCLINTFSSSFAFYL